MNQDTNDNTTVDSRKGKHITYQERQYIERWLKEKKSKSEIARLLGRSRVTIHREIKRGLVRHINTDLSEKYVYNSQRAQEDCEMNQTAHGPALKIGSNHELANQLVELMNGKVKYSPYAARQVLIRKGIDVPFSERTIYNYIKKGILNMEAKDLIQGPRKKRRKTVQKRLAHKNTGALSIEERPAEANERKEIGHFEMDCVVGPQGSKAAVLVLTERKTRYEIMRYLEQKTQAHVVGALNEIEKLLGKDCFREIFKSITTDCGVEFDDAAGIITSCLNDEECSKGDTCVNIGEYIKRKANSEGEKRTKLFQAHPFCSWERGSNENANRLIRRFFPKGTDFSEVTQETLDYVTYWINHYPRKIFGGKSAWDQAKEFRHYFKPGAT